jgi:hypothetical protein
MISKCFALLITALLLANCCGSESGCGPVARSPVAWDGLGSAPSGGTQALLSPPKRPTRAKREIILGPLNAGAIERNSGVQPKDSYERQQAADQDDENKLKRKLMICRTCIASEPVRDDATSH